MLDELLIKSRNFIYQNNQLYKRYFIDSNPLEHRLSIIIGPRGIGKTTSIAQYIMQNYKENEALFVSLDDIEITSNYTLLDIAREFSLNGGKLLCLDEIHKYSTWSAELKNIYDTYPKLKVIATGSCALLIHKGSHDLSRRALVYFMAGMSFREFLGLHFNINFSCMSLQDLLKEHISFAQEIIKVLESQDKKVTPLFKEYLKYGYYPYYLSLPNEQLFFQTLNQNINTSIESDLLNIYPKLNGSSIKKMKMLLGIILKSVPFIPNMTTLKNAIDVKDDRTLKEYLSKLDDAGLIKLLMPNENSLKSIDKPAKIYLANTNLMYIAEPNIGNVRETFFLNQLDNYYSIANKLNQGIYASTKGDFICEGKYIFEVGGKNKDFKQIKDLPDSYIVMDDLEVGIKNKIPLWLFGFLY